MGHPVLTTEDTGDTGDTEEKHWSVMCGVAEGLSPNGAIGILTVQKFSCIVAEKIRGSNP
jgi:hypothetical protein